jgi:hypothetical protein
MKKAIQIFAVLLLVLSSCEKVDRLTQFEIEYDETVTIPAVLGINLPFNIPTPNIETNSAEYFELNNTKKALVEEIRLQKMVLQLEEPSKADFSFIESLTLSISAEGLPDQEIAWSGEIGNEVGNYLILETSEADLKEYIKADYFLLLADIVTDELVSREHTITIHSVFWVDAQIIGQ